MEIILRLLLVTFLSGTALTLGGCGSSSSNNTPLLPERITFAGVGEHGIFDPAVTLDPVTDRLWMSYSAVDPSALWPANYDVVSTHLAYSANRGSSWVDSGTVVNPALDVTLPEPEPKNAGTWVNEVSQLIYDPRAIEAERWKLMWHHYLIIDGERSFKDGWIALKMASSPEGLATATEIKLFGAYWYNSENDIADDATRSPLGGAPLIQLDTALLIPALSTCIFSEPGMYATDDALYLSMLCVRISDNNRQIVLFKCTSPCITGTTGAPNGWVYLGAALDSDDATDFGFNAGFSAPGLFISGDYVYLVATPVQTTTGRPDYYSGCRVFRFTDLDTAQLQMTGLLPTVVDSIDGTADSFNGACSYHRSASNSGILYSELDVLATDKFRIYKSHKNYTTFLK